jgi:hypothetical protein
MNYWIIITIMPFIIISLNIILRLKYLNKKKAIIYGLTDSFLHLIGISFFLLSYEKGIELYTIWAPTNLITVSIPLVILFGILSLVTWLKD